MDKLVAAAVLVVMVAFVSINSCNRTLGRIAGRMEMKTEAIDAGVAKYEDGEFCGRNVMAGDKMKVATKMEVIEPVGFRVLIRKDDDKKETKGGIILPDDTEIPVLTGRVVAISAQVANDINFPIKEYDKVIVNPNDSIPVACEHDNKLFIIPVTDVVAIIRQEV